MAETRRKQAPACLLQPQVGVQWVPDGMVASRDAGSAVGEHHRGHRGTTMSARAELRVFEKFLPTPLVGPTQAGNKIFKFREFHLNDSQDPAR
jgi:hypothetical protein